MSAESGGESSAPVERSPFTLESATAASSQESGSSFDESELPPVDGASLAGEDRQAPSAPPPPQGDTRYEGFADELRQAREQITRQDRAYNQLLGLLAPHLKGLANADQGEQITMEMLASPNASIADLVKFIEQKQAGATQSLLGQMNETAQRHASEMRWRGQLSQESLGSADRSWDSMINKYVGPAYEQNPALKQFFNSQFADPAIAEYGFAALLRLAEWSKGDVAGGYRALFDFLDGKPASSLAKQVQRAADSGADRVAGRDAAQRQGRGIKGFAPGQIRRMAETDPDAFAKLDREITGA